MSVAGVVLAGLSAAGGSLNSTRDTTFLALHVNFSQRRRALAFIFIAPYIPFSAHPYSRATNQSFQLGSICVLLFAWWQSDFLIAAFPTWWSTRYRDRSCVDYSPRRPSWRRVECCLLFLLLSQGCSYPTKARVGGHLTQFVSGFLYRI